MRRVSSRQRLVSWDEFDATGAESNSDNDDDAHSIASTGNTVSFSYDTAIEDSREVAESELSLVGRKRERSTRRSKGHNPQGASPISPLFKPISATQMTDAGKPFMSISPVNLCVPVLISSESWEIGGFSNDQTILKSSISSNTLSSFVSTSSMLLPSPTTGLCTTFETPLTLDTLMKDLRLGIFSFLDLPSLRSIMAVSASYRSLVLSSEGQASLWKKHCLAKWRLMTQAPTNTAGADCSVTTSSLAWLDRFHIPAAAADSGTTNLSLLLQLTPDIYPSGIDEELLDTHNRRLHRIRQPHEDPLVARIPLRQPGRANEQDPPGQLRLYRDNQTGRALVQYTGPTGVGDRCIRSDQPLPRPKMVAPPELESNVAKTINRSVRSFSSPLDLSQIGGRRFFANLLRRGSSKLTGNGSNEDLPQHQWRPFVVPFMENNTTVNVTPRLISYYEVNIHDIVNTEQVENNRNEDEGPGAAPTGQRTDCVAVGLATESFHVHTRMPGWDRQSFGYHGDDGGIFHSSGGMVKEFGSKFGAGDTVGCGIDFVARGIFFTLNGEFLGYGWKGIGEELLQNELYPVVGLDTNYPLHLNFGVDEPFKFDLSQFMVQHETIISSQYSLDKTATNAESRVKSGTLSETSFPSTSSLSTSSTSSSTGRRRFRRRRAWDRR